MQRTRVNKSLSSGGGRRIRYVGSSKEDWKTDDNINRRHIGLRLNNDSHCNKETKDTSRGNLHRETERFSSRGRSCFKRGKSSTTLFEGSYSRRGGRVMSSGDIQYYDHELPRRLSISHSRQTCEDSINQHCHEPHAGLRLGSKSDFSHYNFARRESNGRSLPFNRKHRSQSRLQSRCDKVPSSSSSRRKEYDHSPSQVRQRSHSQSFGDELTRMKAQRQADDLQHFRACSAKGRHCDRSQLQEHCRTSFSGTCVCYRPASSAPISDQSKDDRHYNAQKRSCRCDQCDENKNGDLPGKFSSSPAEDQPSSFTTQRLKSTVLKCEMDKQSARSLQHRKRTRDCRKDEYHERIADYEHNTVELSEFRDDGTQMVCYNRSWDSSQSSEDCKRHQISDHCCYSGHDRVMCSTKQRINLDLECRVGESLAKIRRCSELGDTEIFTSKQVKGRSKSTDRSCQRSLSNSKEKNLSLHGGNGSQYTAADSKYCRDSADDRRSKSKNLTRYLSPQKNDRSGSCEKTKSIVEEDKKMPKSKSSYLSSVPSADTQPRTGDDGKNFDKTLKSSKSFSKESPDKNMSDVTVRESRESKRLHDVDARASRPPHNCGSHSNTKLQSTDHCREKSHSSQACHTLVSPSVKPFGDESRTMAASALSDVSSNFIWSGQQPTLFYRPDADQHGIHAPGPLQHLEGALVQPSWSHTASSTTHVVTEASSTSHPLVSPVQSLLAATHLADPRLGNSSCAPPVSDASFIIEQCKAHSSKVMFRVPTAPPPPPPPSLLPLMITNSVYGSGVGDESPLLDEPSVLSPVAICEATSGSVVGPGYSAAGSIQLDVAAEYSDMVQSLDSVELKKMLDAVTMVKTTLEKTVLLGDDNDCDVIDKQQKNTHMEQVADEVKAALKPFFIRNEIDKEEYKDIMRKAVPKIAASKHSGIDKKKIRSFVVDYIAKVKTAQRRVVAAKLHLLQQQQLQQQQRQQLDDACNA